MAMKLLLRYIGSTTNLGLKYTKHSDIISMEGFVDFDYAGDKDSRKSTSSYYFFVSGNYVS